MAVTSRDLHHQPVQKRVASTPTPWTAVPINRQQFYRGAMLVFALLLLNLLAVRGQVWLDDLHYGRPRTMQLTAHVGHNEQAGQPTHFVAMNLNRRVVVIELPGGDSTKAQTLQGPYLFGANEHLTPVTLRVEDLNNDRKKDLVIAVKNEEIVYINSGDAFRLITDQERQQLVGAN